MKKKQIIWVVFLVLALASIAPVLAQVSTGFDLSWHVLSGGGGARESANYAIDDVLGQWADGRSSSAKYRIEPGFWGAGQEIEPPGLFLPVVMGS